MLKRIILVTALAVAIAGSARAQKSFSDYRPLNGDSELFTEQKALAVVTCSFVNITTNTTTTVKSGKGVLHILSINTKGATANTVTIYDNTSASGTKIATIDTTAGAVNFFYDVAFSTGLTIVTAAGTPADITVSYR